MEAARRSGIAAMTLRRSYNCGILGHHAERLAEAGLHDFYRGDLARSMARDLQALVRDAGFGARLADLDALDALLA